MKTRNTIPRKFWSYFWDVDVAKIDASKSSLFIIQRLIDKGNIEAARWVRKTYSADDIIFTLRNFRDYSLKNANFWSFIYHIPRNEVKCLQEPYLSIRKTLWPY